MYRFLIESPHENDECDKIIAQLQSAGYLHHFEWGCHDGTHCGWAFVESDNIEHARQIVPWEVRAKARIVKVENFANSNDLPQHKTQ